MFSNVYYSFGGYLERAGLDEKDSALNPPECPCGCGDIGYLSIKGFGNLFSTMIAMAYENRCIVFAIDISGKVFYTSPTDDEEDDGEFLTYDVFSFPYSVYETNDFTEIGEVFYEADEDKFVLLYEVNCGIWGIANM